jgi:adenylate cyclase
VVQRSARIHPQHRSVPPEQIIPLLDDYAEAVISAIYDNGGDVMKLIGDGTFAIFTAAAAEEACRSAIAAHSVLQERTAQLNQRRAAATWRP